MPLPDIPLATGTSLVGGNPVAIRAMSRLEVRQLRAYRNSAEDAEPFIVSCGTDYSLAEATAWLGSVDTEVGGVLVNDILVLSGLVDPEADPADPPAGSTGAGPASTASSEP